MKRAALYAGMTTLTNGVGVLIGTGRLFVQRSGSPQIPSSPPKTASIDSLRPIYSRAINKNKVTVQVVPGRP
jgi:hypothetical protein